MKLSTIPLDLTTRQKQVGAYLLNGMSLKAIARQLELSLSTIRAHQKAIKQKLSCENDYEAGYKLALFFKFERRNFNFYL